MVKTDADGDTLWTRTFGGSSFDSNGNGNNIAQLSDGGYVMTGNTYSFGAGRDDVWLIRTDSNGDLVWMKTYGGTERDFGESVIQTSDGGFAIVGWTWSFGEGGSDVYLIKTDSDGEVLWECTYGGSQDDRAMGLVETTDGGFIMSNWTRSYGSGESDVYIVRTDPEGSMLWSKTVGGAGEEWGRSVVQDLDGNYVIAGYTESFGAGGTDVYLIKLGSDVISLYPPSSPVPLSGAFAVNGLLKNMTDEVRSLETQVLVTAPCGQVFDIGPSVLHILQPFECKVIYTVADVPNFIPLGEYLYSLEVYENGETVSASSQGFEVVEGCPGEVLMFQDGELPVDLYKLPVFSK
jgi:hypothetical protein